MSGRVCRMFGVVSGIGLLLLVFLVGVPGAAMAQQRAPAAAPAAGQGDYVGAETCKGCHEDAFHMFGATKMGRLFLKQPRNAQEKLGCETCHGPGKAHVDAGGGKGKGGLITFEKDDPTPVATRNGVCLQCHTKGARLFWQGSPHEGRDVACTNCHKLMQDMSPRNALAQPNEIDTCGKCHQQRRAQQMRSSHMPLREGKMTCSSCHNPHGTVTPSLLKENSVNDTCYNCHTEKRGPFLWEHAPVPENCANCHDPHGSNHERMLKMTKPRICQSCHVETRHPTNPYSRADKNVLGRACTNCHVNIHGSNHPSGNAFTR